MGERVRVSRVPAEGIVEVRWGKTERFAKPSLTYSWGRGVDTKSAARLLSAAIEGPRYSPPLYGDRELPSLAEELEARGFDLTTLRITIRQKPREARDD